MRVGIFVLLVSAFVLAQLIQAQEAEGEVIKTERPFRSLRRGLEVNDDPDPIENEFEAQNREGHSQSDGESRYSGRKRIRHGFHGASDGAKSSGMYCLGVFPFLDVALCCG
jgi:hypothetical protein